MSKTVQGVLVGAGLAALTGGVGAGIMAGGLFSLKTAAWAFGTTPVLGSMSTRP